MYVFILATIIVILLLCIRTKKMNLDKKIILNKTNVVRGSGFYVLPNIMSDVSREYLVNKLLSKCKKQKKLNEDIILTSYNDNTIGEQISKIIGKKLFPVNIYDQQRCWIRYYFSGMKNQYYENFHHDLGRYSVNTKQYRVIIPLHDTSNSEFEIDGYKPFKFTQNTGVILEADNCLHKVKFTSGERLLLIMDFIDKPYCDNLMGHFMCRGPQGLIKWGFDIAWRKLSSYAYKIRNQ